MKVGRNDPCPCGSNKKYKKCCWGKKSTKSSISPIKLRLPKKVGDYFTKVKEKTNKNIVLEIIPSSSFVPGMTARFSFDSNNIKISLAYSFIKNGINNAVARSLVHEATHGLLLFDKGFYVLKSKSGVDINREEMELRNLLSTMIDDIVVNYKIKEEGFIPFGKNYIPMVKKEIKFINKGRDIYTKNLDIGNIYYSKFKIFRYIMAWAFIKYFNLSKDIVSLLKRYLICFKNNFPEEYKECKEIIRLLEKHDIFNPEKHRIVLEKISKIWSIDKKFNLVRLK